MSNLPERTDIRWRNASSGEDTCVDLAHTYGAVRDSKNPDGPVLNGDARALVRAVQVGQIG